MIRWVAVACLLAGLTAPTGAQVFKPKTGSSGSSTTKTTAKTSGSSAKRSSKKSSAHRSKKKSAAASKGRPSDLTPDDAPKVDPDYVKIIDDDE
jgi:hypothetical protein